MKPAPRSSTHQVERGAQAAAIGNFLRACLLMACVRRERSLGELAAELGLPLRKVHHHAMRLVDCGLLRVSRIEPRRGRPIRRYRAIAEDFLVNPADLGEQLADALARELRRSVAEQVNRHDSLLRYHLDELGRLRVRQVDAEGRGPKDRALDHWKLMRLTPEQRIALAGELTALIARYEDAAAGAEGELFLVHAAFAPKLMGG